MSDPGQRFAEICGKRARRNGMGTLTQAFLLGSLSGLRDQDHLSSR